MVVSNGPLSGTGYQIDPVASLLPAPGAQACSLSRLRISTLMHISLKQHTSVNSYPSDDHMKESFSMAPHDLHCVWRVSSFSPEHL